ncbi:hypothetical protein ACNKVE_005767 [Pseudomonas aeruginosa]|uniref:hypothetical protein n=1 Tax=Pseudomonas aeruginosa TaxID=287 RepID=UPI002231747A|nr:hypothetical protein [Pseudomonas aeruginosa]MCW3900402.1 hypothetical protein [Pseudomonas aeruginosa]HBO7924859.1 hypothetical protein [Pseudomonas aeruginosa]
MLSCDQIAELAGALCATAEALGQTLTPTTAEVMAGDLAEFDIDTIAVALQACRRELAGRLTLSAILDRIHGADGRPAANEAWAIALQSYDESETALLTPEVQQAAAAAAPIFNAGDEVGARMAFIAAYDRLVGAARQMAQPVAWILSLGHDAERRGLAIESAQRLGRLPAPQAQLLLKQHGGAPVGNDGRAIAGLLTHDSVEGSSRVRRHLEEIRQGLAVQKHEQREERQAERGAAPEVAGELLSRRDRRRKRLVAQLLEVQRQGDSLIATELEAISERAARAARAEQEKNNG